MVPPACPIPSEFMDVTILCEVEEMLFLLSNPNVAGESTTSYSNRCLRFFCDILHAPLMVLLTPGEVLNILITTEIEAFLCLPTSPEIADEIAPFYRIRCPRRIRKILDVPAFLSCPPELLDMTIVAG